MIPILLPKRTYTDTSTQHAEIPTKEDGSPAQKKPRRSPEQPTPSAPSTAGTGQSQSGPSNANQNPMGGMYAPGMMQNGIRPGGPQFTPQLAPMAINQGHPGMMIPPGAHMVNPSMQVVSHCSAYSRFFLRACVLHFPLLFYCCCTH